MRPRPPAKALGAPKALALGLASLLLWPAQSLAAERLVEASKALHYIVDYLSAAPAARDQFTLVYHFHGVDGAALTGVKLSYVEGAARTPLPLAPDGRLTRLPTLAQAKGQIAAETAAGQKVQVKGPSIEPTLAAARELPAPRLASAVAQVNGMITRIAGLASALAPSYDRVRFEGAGGGAVVEANGAKKPLPLQQGAPVFEPAAHPGARTVLLDRAPTRMEIGSKPKA